jgi:hypothetical protein
MNIVNDKIPAIGALKGWRKELSKPEKGSKTKNLHISVEDTSHS